MEQRFLFSVRGRGGGVWRIGRFHQRAKGVAADFSERGEEGWNDYVCQGKFERKRATVVDGQEGGRVERGRESDVTKKKRDGRTNGEKERHKERGRNERKKKISPRGGRGDWHSRLVKLRWPRMENEVFEHAWKGDGRGVERERERAAIGHGRSI